MTITEPTILKRIKRHVVGRNRRYFIVSPPGFENLCLKELLSFPLTAHNASVIPGGVEFVGRLHDCYLANLYLRTANRVLMRICQIKAANFKELEKRASEVPWELFLQPNAQPKIHTTARHCRLYHTAAISERILNGIAKSWVKWDIDKNHGVGGAAVPTIFVRGMKDRFTLSIDSSGEHLHRRGLKQHSGKAPLRETIAAAALLLAGYTGHDPLVDPMCGSGAFSLEAALMVKNVPPGWFREFAFMHWPSFQPKRWAYLKRQAGETFSSPSKPIIFASDSDRSACLRLNQCIQRVNLTDTIRVSQQNFFELKPDQNSGRPGFIALNPPYGRRLGQSKKIEALFRSIYWRLKKCYKGWKLILIAPGRVHSNKIPFEVSEYPIYHGGLKLRLMVGKIH